jgi:D-tyrosyl-tRNA(Tyr) deacylase
MRALLQRVLEAKVVVDGETTGEIQKGILVFLGLAKEDNFEKGQKLIDKILKYRFFDDELNGTNAKGLASRLWASHAAR